MEPISGDVEAEVYFEPTRSLLFVRDLLVLGTS